MFRPAPTAGRGGCARARREVAEAGRGNREGRVGRAGVGRSRRRPPPELLRAAHALALLPEEAPP